VLAVATSKPRFYQLAVRELKKEGMKFLSLSPGDEIPPDVDLVVTSLGEQKHFSFPRVVTAVSAAEAVREALNLSTGLKKRYSSISIGIDPGKSVGIVALGDGRVIFEEVLGSPEDVPTSIKEIEKKFKTSILKIKVGSAGGTYRNRIISRIQESLDYPVEIVDEGSTTKPKVESRRLGLHKDILAARKIAHKTGKPINSLIEVTATSGEIKNIQRESRKRSKNLTISKLLAEAVIKGEIDLDEALRLQKKGRTKDLHPS
jgi:hypothetical protein